MYWRGLVVWLTRVRIGTWKLGIQDALLLGLLRGSGRCPIEAPRVSAHHNLRQKRVRIKTALA